jgi:hypothetical protein
MNLGQATLGGLQKADTVLHVSLSLIEAANLVLQLLADRHPCGVVSCLVDPESTRKLA